MFIAERKYKDAATLTSLADMFLSMHDMPKDTDITWPNPRIDLLRTRKRETQS